MVSKLLVASMVALIALAIPPVAGSAPVGQLHEAPSLDAPWWSTWPGDLDRDGIQDHLEELAARDPDARLEVVVDLDRRPTQRDVEGLEALGVEVQYVSRYVDAVLGTVRPGSLETVRSLPGVVMLEWQGRGLPLLASAGPSVGMPTVREEMGFDGAGVTVAVLDTGVLGTHESLDDLDDSVLTDDPKLVAFYDAYSNSTTEPFDAGEHGTWVAGIAVGTGQPGGQNIGGAPGAKLVGVRIGDPGGFPEHTALRGIEWTIENKDTYNISVMVCSWGIVIGGPNAHNGNSAVSRAVDRAVAEGINVVVSGGNSALSATVTAPGDARNVVTVGSVNDDHRLSSFSSEGPTTDGRIKPDVCAPGEDIRGPWSRSDTGWFDGDGTSAAAPLVGGIIACMMEANPDLTPGQVKQVLHETSEHNTARSAKYFFTPNNGYGWGVVHAPGAVSRARDLRSPGLDVPVALESGQDLDLEVRGSYTRTPFTEFGENGQSRLGEDEVVLEATIPEDWAQPSQVRYTMEGDIIATVIPELPTVVDGSWQLRATFRVRDDVNTLTTATPTIRFTTTTMVATVPETYTLTTRETLNGMEGPRARIRVSVGGNVPPEIELVNPHSGPEEADTFYVIRWTDDDPDDDARVSLYNDLDTDPASGRVLIASGLREDQEGDGDSYLWDTSTLVEGRSFYVQAVIDDGTNPPVSVYSEGTVTIRHTGGNAPPSVDVLEPDGRDDAADLSYTIQYVARDPDDVARVSLYWDVDGQGFDGNAIVRDLEEVDGQASYVWDTSDQPDGAELWVYAVVSDGKNPQAREYGDGPVTIEHERGPEVLDAQPTGTDVGLDELVRVAFDREMDRASTEAATTIQPFAPGSFSWVGFTLRFDPTGGWAPNTTYTMTVSTNARDAQGLRLDPAHSWSFTTRDAPGPQQPPVVTVDVPREGETVSGDVWIEGTFDHLDARGVVEVRIDGGSWREAAVNEDRWSLLWDTLGTPDGEHTISVRGRTSRSETGEAATVNVTVRNAPNSPPEVAPVQDQTVRVGRRLVVQVEASDDDGDDLVYSDDSPVVDIDPFTGVITLEPTEDQVAVWQVTVTVSDGVDQTSVSFAINVVSEGGQGGGFLDSLPLTPLQLGVIVLILAVIVSVVALRRGAAKRERDLEGSAEGRRGSVGSGGDAL